MPKHKAKKTKRANRAEAAIENALQPGSFIEDDASWLFVSDLEGVENQIEKLADSDPEGAVGLYETFLAGCYEKAEEIDDSSGSFGMFVNDLFCGWAEARQKTHADPHETAERLLAWIDDDPYGFAYDLERDLSRVLQKKERQALAAAIRARFDAAAPANGAAENPDQQSHAYRRWGESLKTIYAAGREIDAYVAICEATEFQPADCEVIAEIYQVRGKPEKALSWVERGLELQGEKPFGRGSSYKLEDMKRALLLELGRDNEALESAWRSFADNPHGYSYDELMKYVPKPERRAWHQRVLKIVTQTNLSAAVGLLLKINETDLLLERLKVASNDELESLSHSVTESAAKKLARSHPDVAAKVYRALGMRILNSKKSKYYAAALANFERAKHYYEKAELASSWQTLVDEVRANHGRKYSFMPGFDDIVAGKGPSTEPSFLKRAKKRWHK